MHVVVTGSTGFVGSALVPELINRGHEVTVILREPINRGSYFDTSEFSYVKCTELYELTEQEFPTCDAVIHLAGISHRKGQNERKLYERVNYETAIHIATLAETFDCKHFIFMSTAKVHADATEKPINSNSPYDPPDLYAETKARAEQTLLGSGFSMKITALRPPAVLGLPAKANLKHLINLAKSNLIIPVSTPANKRCYIGLENLCFAVIDCLENECTMSGGFLIHDESPISTRDLINTIAESLGRKQRTINVPKSIFEVGNFAIKKISGKSLLEPFYKDFEIDCEEFKNLYGWSPHYSTEEYIHLLFGN